MDRTNAPKPADDRLVVPTEDGRLEVRQVRATTGGARKAWQRVLDDDENLPWAAPVLLDDEGHDMLPTGEVTARFETAPSDEDLDEVARRHGLTVRGRNEFVPAQVVFVPEDRRSAYLPELAERLAEESNVTAAWPNTRSRYERS